jgi:hypothetical protein
MYTLYILTAIGALVGLRFYFRGTRRTVGEFLYCTLFSASCGLVAGFLLAMFFNKAVPTQDLIGERITLVSMRNESGISGSFIFGSGSVNSGINYHFLKKQDDNSMVPDSVQASDLVHFIEDATLANVGYWQTTFRQSDSSHWLYKWTLFHKENNRIIRQEFRVPVGSVIQQFKIQ